MRNPLRKSTTKTFFRNPGILLAFLALSLFPSLIKAQSAFTPGNLVVEQVGNGTSALGSGASPINFVEFSTSGTVAQSVSASTTTFSESGKAGTAACLTLSADGTTLVFVAYNEAANGAAGVTSSTVNREVGFVTQGSSPTPGVATYFTNSGASSDGYTGNNIKGAYFDGTTIWCTGNEASSVCSIRANTVTSGGAASPNTQLSSVASLAASCGIGVFKDQLFFTQSGGSGGTFQLGTGKPTTSGQTATAIGGTYAALNAVYLNVTNANPGHPDVMYTADDGKTGLLHKYYWNTGSSAWALAGTTVISNTTTAGVGGYITADMNSTGGIDLYVVIGEGNSAPNYIIKCTDVSPITTISSITPTTVLSAGTDYEFTGISWAPSLSAASYSISASNWASTLSTGNLTGGNYGDITIPSGVTATLTGNIYVNGTLTVQSGGTLECGNYFVFSPKGSFGTFDLQSGATLETKDDSGITNYTATGSIQCFSRFYSSGANYIYDGSVAQTTGNGLTGALNLTINNSKGLTLNAPFFVTNSLTFTSGNITLGNNKLTIASGGTISGASASNYILTNGTGALEMTAGTTAVTFPVGDSYNHIKVATTSGTATFDVLVASYVTTSTNVAGTNHAVKRTWSITPTSGTIAVVTPQWDDANDLAGVNFLDAYSFVSSRSSALGSAYNAYDIFSTWIPSQTAGHDVNVSGTLYNRVSGNITMVSGSTYLIGVFDSTSAYNAVDAGIYSIQAPKASACVGAQPVKVILRNYGSASLTAATIGWSVNGVTQTPYSWTGSLASFATTSVSIGSYTFAAGNYTINAGTSNPNGIADSVNINDASIANIVVNVLPVAAVAASSTVCAGTSVSIGSSTLDAGSSYSWSPSTGLSSSTSNNPSVAPTSTTSYTLTETNPSGCSASNSVTITTKPIPAAAAGSQSTICIGASAFTIGASSVTGSTYSWGSSGGGFSSTISNPSVQPASTTTYTVTETGTNGCSNSNSVTVTVVGLPAASVISNTAICAGSSLSIGATSVSGSSYAWTSTISGYSSTVSNPSVVPASTSAYTLTETNASGCSKSNSVTINVNGLPVAAAGSPSTICSGAAAFTIGASAVTGSTYSWSPSTGLSSSTLSNPLASPTSTTTYTVTETNTSGCSKSNTVTITVNPLPAASVISNTAICVGNSISIGNATVTGSSYSWTSTISGYSSTVSNPSVTPASTATYTLTETNANTCVKSNSVTITVNALPAAAVATATTSCAGTAISVGAATVTGSTYSWVSSVGGFTSTLANPSVSPTTTTSYTLTETNLSGCVKSNSTTITVSPVPAASVVSGQAICAGSGVAIGAALVSADTYSWASTPTGFGSTLSNPTVNPASTTSYTLTETITATGCQKSNSVKITVNPSPSAYTGPNKNLCIGNSLLIGGSPVTGNSYAWTSVLTGFTSTVSSVTVTPTTTTEYILTESVSGSCSRTDTVTITVNPLPAASAGTSIAVCVGLPATIGAATVSGDNYSWASIPSGFTSTVSTSSVTPTATTTYILTESNPVTGCSNTNSVLVTVNALPAANTGGNTAVCKGSSATIGATSATGRTYAWVSSPAGFTSTGSNPKVSPASTTSYTLTETNTTTGCAKSNSLTVTVNPLPAAAVASATSTCAGNSVTVGTSTAVVGNTYLWSSIPLGYSSTVSNPAVTPSANTTYTLVETITATGCTNSNSVLVTVNAPPAANAGSSSTICAGSSAIIGAASVAGSSYSWASNPTGYSSTASGNTVSPTTTTIYTLTETSAAGCVKFNTTTVTVSPYPSATISAGSNAICAGNTTALVNSSPVTGNLYQWYLNGNAITGATNSGYSASTGGNYYEMVTNAGGCSVNSNVLAIKVNPLPNAIVKLSKSATICEGDSVALVATLDSNVSYQWSNLAASPSTITGATSYRYVATTSGTYQVQITSLAGCTDVATSVVVTVNTPPASSISTIGSTTFCSGGSVKLNATAVSGINYAWYSNNVAVSGATTNSYTATVSGSYSLQVADATTGCSSVSTPVAVTVNSLPVANVTALGNTSFCQGGGVILVTDYDPTYTYKWSNTSGALAGETKDTMTVKTSGTYTVTATNGGGCSVTSSGISVTASALPAVSIAKPTSTAICQGTTLALNATTGLKSYQWALNGNPITGATSASYTVSQTGTYEVLATNTAGCSAFDTLSITVNSTPVAGFITPTSTICAGGIAVFANQSYISSGSLTYNWTFGDGGTSNAENIAHSYTAAGTFNVQLTAASLKGCFSSAKGVITVLPVNSSAFTTSSFGYERIVFHAADNTDSSYSWNFGDSVTGSGKSEYHQYPAAGTYTVTLTVTNANGCSSTTTSPVVVQSSGVDEQTGDGISINVYPNPFVNQTNVVYHLNQSVSVAIEVFDIDGKRVAFVSNAEQPEGDHTYILNGSKPGTYFIKMMIDNKLYMNKVVQQ